MSVRVQHLRSYSNPVRPLSFLRSAVHDSYSYTSLCPYHILIDSNVISDTFCSFQLIHSVHHRVSFTANDSHSYLQRSVVSSIMSPTHSAFMSVFSHIQQIQYSSNHQIHLRRCYHPSQRAQQTGRPATKSSNHSAYHSSVLLISKPSALRTAQRIHISSQSVNSYHFRGLYTAQSLSSYQRQSHYQQIVSHSES